MCGYVSTSLRNSLIKARRAQSDAAKAFELVRLTKAGTPSRISGAAERFASEEEAAATVAYRRRLNPGQTLRYALNGVEI